MALNISDLKSGLRFGGARPTLFQVQIFNPVNQTANIDIPIKVRAASLPAWTTGTIPVMYMGREVKFAGDRQFQPWQVVVINDEDFTIRNALEEWNNALNTLEGNTRGFPSSQASLYKSQAQVQQLDRLGNVIREYTFKGLWPAQISDIQLDWNGRDQIEEFQVVFEYDSFEVTGGRTGLAGGV